MTLSYAFSFFTFTTCLYPCYTVLLFLHILFLHNHTKTHTILFYSVLVLIVLNGQVSSCVFKCFSFLMPKFCCVIVGFLYWIVSSCFSCYKLDISMFSDIFHGFPKTALFINLKKSFSKSLFFCLDLCPYH